MSLINCPECNKEISDKAKSCPNCGYELPIMIYGVYCPKCLNCGIKTQISICPYCHTRYKDSIYGACEEVDNYTKNHPELKQSPEYSEEAYQARINYVPGSYITPNSTKCAYCGSTNVRKISTAGRIVSTGLFGLGSKKIGKQWHCNSCGSDF